MTHHLPPTSVNAQSTSNSRNQGMSALDLQIQVEPRAKKLIEIDEEIIVKPIKEMGVTTFVDYLKTQRNTKNPEQAQKEMDELGVLSFQETEGLSQDSNNQEEYRIFLLQDGQYCIYNMLDLSYQVFNPDGQCVFERPFLETDQGSFIFPPESLKKQYLVFKTCKSRKATITLDSPNFLKTFSTIEGIDATYKLTIHDTKTKEIKTVALPGFFKDITFAKTIGNEHPTRFIFMGQRLIDPLEKELVSTTEEEHHQLILDQHFLMTYIFSYDLETSELKILHKFPKAFDEIYTDEHGNLEILIAIDNLSFILTPEERKFQPELTKVELKEQEAELYQAYKILPSGELYESNGYILDNNQEYKPIYIGKDQVLEFDQSRNGQIVPFITDFEESTKVHALSAQIRSSEKYDVVQYIPPQFGRLHSYATYHHEYDLHFLGEQAEQLTQDFKNFMREYRLQHLSFPNWQVFKEGDNTIICVGESFDFLPKTFVLQLCPFKVILVHDSFKELGQRLVHKSSPHEYIVLKARDGLEISSLIAYPHFVKPEERKNLPTLLYLHGGPQDTRNDRDVFHIALQQILSYGYAVLMPNFRGSGGYGDRFQDLGQGEWHGKMTDDIVDITQHFIKEGIINPDLIFAYGASYGGFSVSSIMTRYPDLLQGGYAAVGEYNLTQVVKSSQQGKTVHLPEGLAKQFKADIRYPEIRLAAMLKLEQSSPYFMADQIKKPLLIGAAALDKICLPEESRQLFDRLKKHGKETYYVEYKQEGHVFEDPLNIKLDQKLLLHFMAYTMPNFKPRYMEPLTLDEIQNTPHVKFESSK